MEYPALVYRCPGEHACKGGTFDAVGVDNVDQHIAKLEAGWCMTLDDAIAGKKSTAEVASMRSARAKDREAAEYAKIEAEERMKAEREADEKAAKAEADRIEGERIAKEKADAESANNGKGTISVSGKK